MDTTKSDDYHINLYTAYVEDHLKNICNAWDAYRSKLESTKYRKYIPTVNNLIKIHDQSKYTTFEFNQYANYYYGNKNDPDIFKHFQLAVSHHYKHNPHHPEYWIDNTIIPHSTQKLKVAYIMEMVVDWGAMAIVYGDSPKKFFETDTYIQDKVYRAEHDITILNELLDIYETAIPK